MKTGIRFGVRLGRLGPNSGGVNEISERLLGGSSTTEPIGIAADFSGGLWFTESASNKIGRLNFGFVAPDIIGAIPTADSFPWGITPGPDGAMWFTENRGNKIGRITQSSLTEYPIPNQSSGPLGITWGPDGALWFTEFGSGSIRRFDPNRNLFTTFKLPTPDAKPMEIVGGPDGALWFTEFGANKIRYSPDMCLKVQGLGVP